MTDRSRSAGPGSLRPWTLEGQKGVVSRDIFEAHVCRQPVFEPGKVLVRVGGIDHQQNSSSADPIDQQIIHVGAGVGQQTAVVNPPWVNFDTSLGVNCWRKDSAPGPLHPELPHVGDIEEARRGAHRAMLLHQTGVLDRQLPTGKVHDLAAGPDMGIEERSSLRLVSDVMGTPSVWARQGNLLKGRLYQSPQVSLGRAAVSSQALRGPPDP